jgi:hypothetical protein
MVTMSIHAAGKSHQAHGEVKCRGLVCRCDTSVACKCPCLTEAGDSMASPMAEKEH